MKKILIIGATSTIAHACARRWATQGCDFFLVARNTDKLVSNAADLRARGAGHVDTYQMDVTHFSEHPAMLADCLAVLQQIDVVLLAHGTLPDQKACEQNAGLAVQEFITNGASVIALLTVLARQFEVQQIGRAHV